MISKLQLSEEQLNALHFFQNFVKNPDTNVAVIKGKAGTGKTTIIQFIIEWLEDSGIDYTLIAPTNKASNILREKTQRETKTIHSFLKMSPNLSITKLDMKDLEFQSNFDDWLGKDHIIICDEGSMVNDALYDFMEDICKEQDCKILYILDEAQLAPVKNRDKSKTTLCPTFYYLSHVFRQSDESSLKDILLELRTKDIIHYSESKNLKLFSNRKEFAISYIDFIKEYVYNKEVSKTKLLCFTNKQVQDYNKFCHLFLFKDKSEFLLGEQIIFKETVKNKDILNGETGVVIENNPIEIEIPFVGVFDGYLLSIKKEDDTIVNVEVLSNSLKREEYFHIADILEQFRLKAIYSEISTDWANYYKIYNSFFIRENIIADNRVIKSVGIDYGYAVTTHYSQGSTYDNVFIDMKDINICANKEARRQLKYVALSRPKNNAYILNG